MNIIYWGLFTEETIKGNLEKEVKDQHITFKFKPNEEDEILLLGGEYTVNVVGYASDGENEGVLVEIPEELKRLYKNPAPPHITISVSETGKPVDTGKLNFTRDIPEHIPKEIKCRVGYFVGGRVLT